MSDDLHRPMYEVIEKIYSESIRRRERLEQKAIDILSVAGVILTIQAVLVKFSLDKATLIEMSPLLIGMVLLIFSILIGLSVVIPAEWPAIDPGELISYYYNPIKDLGTASDDLAEYIEEIEATNKGKARDIKAEIGVLILGVLMTFLFALVLIFNEFG